MSSRLIPFIANGYIANGYIDNSNINNCTITNTTFSNSSGNFVNLSVSNAANIGNLLVNGNTNLGNITNITITGGSNGYFLKTDGNGNLSWTTSNATIGGFNTYVQYNNAGLFDGSAAFTFNNSTNTVSMTNMIVNNTSNLGSVSNVTITGGTPGYFLQTDGTGNLTWSPFSGNGNSNLTGWNTVQSLSVPSLFFGIYKNSYGNTSNYIPSGSLAAGNIRIDNGLLSNSLQVASISKTGPNLGATIGQFSIIGNTIFLNSKSAGTGYNREINNYNASWNTIFSPNLSNLPATSGNRFFSNICYVQGNYYILGASISKTVFPNTSNINVILYKSSTANSTNSWTEHYTFSSANTSPYINDILNIGIAASANDVVIYFSLYETNTPPSSNLFTTLYRSFTSNAANANSFSAYSIIISGGNTANSNTLTTTPIVYNNNKFLLGTSFSGNNLPNIITSTDGNIWSTVTGPTNNANATSTTYTDVTVQNNNYILLGQTNSNIFSASSIDSNSWNVSNIATSGNVTLANIYSLNNTTNTLLSPVLAGTTQKCYFSTDLGNTWTNINTTTNFSSTVFGPVYESNRQTITFYLSSLSSPEAQIQIPAINTLDTAGKIYDSVGNGYYQFLGGDNNNYGLFVKTGNI